MSDLVYTETGGSVSETLQVYLDAQYIKPEAYGAVGNGSTNDQAAIQAAATAATSAGKKLVLTKGKNYRINSTVVIKCDLDAAGATISTPQNSNFIAIQYGDNTGLLEYRTADFPDVTTSKSAYGWAYSSSIGVKLYNLTNSKVRMGRIVNFYDGILLTAVGGHGACYNIIELGRLENNKRNLHVIGGEDISSWANENVFIGGSCIHYSDENVPAGTRDMLLESYPSGNGLNSLHFLGFCFEGGTQPEHPLEIYGASDIEFVGGRYEVATSIIINGMDATRVANNIKFLGGYGLGSTTITQGSNSSSITVETGGEYVLQGGGTTGGIRTVNGSSDAYPAMTLWSNNDYSSIFPSNTGTTWMVGLGVNACDFKGRTDTVPRFRINPTNGQVYFGDGSTALGPYLTTTTNNAGVQLVSGSFTAAKALIASGTTPLSPATGSTVTVDCSLGNLWLITLPTNGTAITMATPTNPSQGQTISIIFAQGTTDTAITWPSSSVIKWVNGNKTISTGSGAITLVSMVYTGSVWVASLGQNVV